MSRIFVSLAFTAMALLLVTMFWGLIGEDYNGLSMRLRTMSQGGDNSSNGVGDDQAQREILLSQLKTAQAHVRIHMLLGILAALITVLVQSIGVTYFIGTGRWCKEVSAAYALDEEVNRESAALKRKAFPFALLGITVVMVIAALGAAADPGTLSETTQRWVTPHYVAALAGVCVIAGCLWMQTQYIRRNQELIDRVVGMVREVRADRGLEV